MAVTDLKSPTASSTPGVSWSDEANIFVSDNARALWTGPTNDTLVAETFGFAIPDNGHTHIFGIELWVEGNGQGFGAATTRSIRAQLRKAGTEVGETKKSSFPRTNSNEDIKIYGGAGDLWNADWTAADINHANFGVVFDIDTSDGTSNRKIDHVQMRIHYAEGGFISYWAVSQYLGWDDFPIR